jgi:hypothetical protein
MSEHDVHESVEHETTDVDLKGISLVAIISVVIIIVSLVLLDDLFVMWVENDKQEYVYSVESVELREIRAADAQKLNSYAVVDAEKGAYRIPIDQAMKLIADEDYARRSR